MIARKFSQRVDVSSTVWLNFVEHFNFCRNNVAIFGSSLPLELSSELLEMFENHCVSTRGVCMF